MASRIYLSGKDKCDALKCVLIETQKELIFWSDRSWIFTTWLISGFVALAGLSLFAKNAYAISTLIVGLALVGTIYLVKNFYKYKYALKHRVRILEALRFFEDDAYISEEELFNKDDENLKASWKGTGAFILMIWIMAIIVTVALFLATTHSDVSSLPLWAENMGDWFEIWVAPIIATIISSIISAVIVYFLVDHWLKKKMEKTSETIAKKREIKPYLNGVPDSYALRLKYELNKGLIFMENEQYKNAREIFEKWVDLVGKDNEKMVLYNLLGICQYVVGKLNKAHISWKSGLEIAKKLRDLKGESAFLGNMGNVYQTKGELDNALEYYRECLNISAKIGYAQGFVSAARNIYLLCKEDKFQKACETLDGIIKEHPELKKHLL